MATWAFPHYRFTCSRLIALDLLEKVELAVPGARVYATTPDNSWFKLTSKMDELDRVSVDRVIIRVHVHGAYLVEEWFERQGIAPQDVKALHVDDLIADCWHTDARLSWLAPDVPWPATDPDGQLLDTDDQPLLDFMEVEGRKLIKAAEDRGELKPGMSEVSTAHQARGSAWIASRGEVKVVWPAGRGKTRNVLQGLAHRAGDALVACIGSARKVWVDQATLYTNWAVYRVYPEAERKAMKHPTLKEFLVERRRLKGRGVELPRLLVVVAIASIALYVDILEELYKAGLFRPTQFVIDEIHTIADHRRWEIGDDGEGNVTFSHRKTKGTATSAEIDRLKRSAAAAVMRSLPSIVCRIGMTATKIADGRPKRLWGPLDLVHHVQKGPGPFGPFRSYADRYCDAMTVELPTGQKIQKITGQSNMAELTERCRWFLHNVTYAESSIGMNQVRMDIRWLDASEQDKESDSKGGYWVKKLKSISTLVRKAEAGKLSQRDIDKLGLEDDGDTSVPWHVRSLTELRIAQAALSKRKWVVAQVAEAVRSGQKVVVLTARKPDCEALAEAIGKALGKKSADLGSLAEVPVKWYHGGRPDRERDELIDWFRAVKGACVAVGTGQALGTAADGLQVADQMFITMAPWDPFDLLVQWPGRVDRYEGVGTLITIVLARGTYDERVVAVLMEKSKAVTKFFADRKLTEAVAMLGGRKADPEMRKGILQRLGIDTTWKEKT